MSESIAPATRKLRLFQNTNNRPGARELDLAIYQGPRGLRQLEKAWQQLAEEFATHYLHYPEWYRHKLVTENNPDEVFFFTYYAGSQLVAVVPLKREEMPVERLMVKLQVPVWTLYYPDEMGVCDALIARPYATAAFLNRLNEDLRLQDSHTAAALLCKHIPAQGHLAACLETTSSNRCLVKLSHESKYLATEQDYDSLLETYSKKFVRNLKRKQKRLHEQGDVCYETVRQPADMAVALDAFFQAEASGWKGAQGSALANQPVRQHAYRSMMLALAERGKGAVHLLRLNNKVIAAQLAIYAGTSIYILKIGFDESHNAISPGFLLMNHVLQCACENPAVKRLSFVTGVGWIDVWKPQAEPVLCAYSFRWDWLNQGMAWYMRHRNPGQVVSGSSALPHH